MENTTEGLEEQYRVRYEQVLKKVAKTLEEQLKDHVKDIPRIDRISARAKHVDRFLKKAAAKRSNGQPKYADPINQIQDQVGARIITFYLEDVDQVSKQIESYYNSIETQVIVPDSEKEFGYFGKHYIFLLPEDVLEDDMSNAQVPNFFELQVKTLFQHAWSEAEHDLGYKPQDPLLPEEKRKIAFSAAQAWGADQIFAELFSSRKGRCGKLKN